MNDDELDRLIKTSLQDDAPVPPRLQAQTLRRIRRAPRAAWLLRGVVVAIMVEGVLALWLAWQLLAPSFIAPLWFALAAAVLLGSGVGVLVLAGGDPREGKRSWS